MHARLLKRTAAALTVGLLALAAATASAATRAEAGKAASTVTLTYFTFSAAPDHLKDLNNIVAAFEKANPTIKINVQTSSYNDYFTKLQTQVASGQAPDTFELNYENFVTYASNGQLLNLTKSAKTDRTFKPSVYYPRAYEAFSNKNVQYGLPETFSVVLLFYNKDLFKQAGVPFPKPTWKWDDELAAAKKLSDPGKGVFGDFQPIQFWEFYKVLAQNGGTFFNASKTAAAFNSPQGIDALNWLMKKVPSGVMPTKEQMGGRDDGAMFKAGKLAMWHTGIWMFTDLKAAPFEWDVVVEPGNARKAHHFFSNAVVASSKTKHPREAWKWLRYFTSSSTAARIRVGNSWELPAVKNPKYFSLYLEQSPPANRRAVFDALDHIVTPPVIKQQQQLQDTVGKWLEKAAAGDVSAADALNKAAAEVNQLLKGE